MVLNISNLNLIPNSLGRLYVKKIMYKRCLTYFLDFEIAFKIDIYKFYFNCITIAFILDPKRKDNM